MSMNGQGNEPTIRELVSSATSDVTTMINSQIELAKAEVKQSANKAVEGAGLLVVAGVIAFLGVIFLLITIAQVMIHFGMDPWVAYGIVTLALFIIAALLALFGRKNVKKVKGPQKARAQLEQTKAAFSSSTDS